MSGRGALRLGGSPARPRFSSEARRGARLELRRLSLAPFEVPIVDIEHASAEIGASA